MTTYHFKRTRGDLGVQGIFNLAYFKFLSLATLFFLLDFINIPSFFEGNFSFFVFESFLFTVLIRKNKQPHLLTLFLFYGIFDLFQLNFIGTSFIAFIVSFLIFFFLSKFLTQFKKNIFFQSIVLLPIFLILFVYLKLFLMNLFLGFIITGDIIIFFAKSILYTSLFYLNFHLLFSKNFTNKYV
jgi:hypothetical protein